MDLARGHRRVAPTRGHVGLALKGGGLNTRRFNVPFFGSAAAPLRANRPNCRFGSLVELWFQLWRRDSPTPWGRPERRLCRAAAGAGSPGGCIPQLDEAWILLDPASERCSLVGPPGLPVEHSGTGSPAGIPLSLAEEVVEGSPVGFPAWGCWGAVTGWGPVGQGGMEEAAWADDRHR